jgi:hypothetical protein
MSKFTLSSVIECFEVAAHNMHRYRTLQVVPPIGQLNCSFKCNSMGYSAEQQTIHIANCSSVFCVQAHIMSFYERFTVMKN